MKVAYISTSQDVIPRWQLEITTLLKNGYDVMVICLDRLHSRAVKEKRYGVDIIRIQPKRKKNEKNKNITSVATWGVKNETTFKKIKTIAIEYYSFIKLIKKNSIKIIHCCHPSLLPVAWYAKKKFRCKLIYEVSEFYVQQIFMRLPKILHFLEIMVEKIEDFFIQFIDGVVCYPSIDDVLYKRYFKKCSNIKVVANVPELKCSVDQKLYDKLKEKYIGRKLFIYTGSLILKDGIMDVLLALRTVCDSYPELKLLLVGSSLDDDSDTIKEFAKRSGLSDNVEIIPFQPYEKLYSYFLAADIGLAAYNKSYVIRFTKGNSRKVMEYMKGSLPIIGPDYGEVTLAVKEERCGIILDEWESSAISDAIKYLLDNPEVKKKMANRSKNAFEREYNWEVEKKKLLEVYKRALMSTLI